MVGTSNSRPVQGGDPAMNGEVSSADWRMQLQPGARPRIVNKIMDTLKKHLPISGPEGLGELRKIAVRFEEKIYTAATSQSDYLRKISMKMLTMEQKAQGTTGANQLSTNANAAGQNPAAQELKDLNEKSRESFNEIKNRLDLMTTQLNDHVIRSYQQINEVQADLRNYHEVMVNYMEQGNNQLREFHEEMRSYCRLYPRPCKIGRYDKVQDN